jgi:hypothetical protein
VPNDLEQIVVLPHQEVQFGLALLLQQLKPFHATHAEQAKQYGLQHLYFVQISTPLSTQIYIVLLGELQKNSLGGTV